jgi:hypothetical protein
MLTFVRNRKGHEASAFSSKPAFGQPDDARAADPLRHEIRPPAGSDGAPIQPGAPGSPLEEGAARPPVAFDFGRMSMLPPGGRPEPRWMPPPPRERAPSTSSVAPPGPVLGVAGRAIQPKLAVSQPGDEQEEEADKTAERVMRMPDPAAGGVLQRKCTACEEEKKVQPKREGAPAGGMVAPPIVHEVLRSPGRPLDAETRAFMEPRFAHDFGRVRVHADARAAESARAVGARAFTVGHAVVFGASEYAPRSNAGRSLLAPELTHTIQQGSSTPRTLSRQAADPTPQTTPDATTPTTAGGPGPGAPAPGAPAPGAPTLAYICTGGPDPTKPRARLLTQHEQNVVSAALWQARSLASQALMVLARRDPRHAKMAQSTFHRALTVEQLQDTIRRIHDALDSLHVNGNLQFGTCEDDGGCNTAGVAARTLLDLSGVLVCSGYFRQSLSANVITLLHEAGHKANIDNSTGNPTANERYCADGLDCETVCDLTGDLTQNVDAWARFISCVANG